MRLYHFTILFAIFSILLLTVTLMSVNERTVLTKDRIFLDNALDRATDRAVQNVAAAGESGIAGIRDETLKVFYESLAAELGLTGDTPSTERLSLYVPVILISDGKEICVYYERTAENASGVMQRGHYWSEIKNCTDTTPADELEYYCNLQNTVNEMTGVKYNVNISSVSGGLFVRNAEGPLLAVLMQGYPLRSVRGGIYNRFTFAGTGYKPLEKYYINSSGDGYASPGYYHCENCELRAEESVMYNTRRECALYGAYECPVCGGDIY